MSKIKKQIIPIFETPVVDTLNKFSVFTLEDTTHYGKTFPIKFAQKIDSINNLESGKIYRKSMFPSHELKCKNIENATTHVFLPSWLTIVTLLIIYGLVRIRISYYKRIKQIINALYAVRYTAQINREDGIYNHKGALELFSIFVLSTALLTYYYYSNKINMPLSDFKWNIFLKIAGVIILIYLIKAISFNLFSQIIKLEKEFSVYLTNVVIFNEAIGLIFIPFIVLLIYMPFENKKWIYVIAITLFAILYIYRFIRGIIIITSSTKFSKFYLFLYLCTLEILPSLLLIKYLLDLKVN